MAGELSRVFAVQWNSDQQHIVLEIKNEEGKGAHDSERCTFRQLLEELQDAGVTDPTINSHDLLAPLVDGSVSS